jgi:hypothetical protein
MSSPPIIPSAAKDQIHSDQEKNVIAVKKENIEAKVQGENQKDSSVIKDLSRMDRLDLSSLVFQIVLEQVL